MKIHKIKRKLQNSNNQGVEIKFSIDQEGFI